MNYRHAYHAGNFADVVKHAVLTLLLAHLKKKEAAFAVIDTHAGIGRYDLAGDEAERTGEAREGVLRLLAGGPLPPLLEGYEAALRAVNPDWPDLRFYPGSPRLARALMRPRDRLALVELHPEDVAALRREFAGDRQVGVHHQDAYVALKALLPPPERRGLVLIDPPFEQPDEFRRVAKGLGEALRRWPTGIFAVWYPVKESDAVERFLGELGNFGRPGLAAQLLLRPWDRTERLNGSGLAVLNPPWMLEESLADLLPLLHDRLGAAGGISLRSLGPS